MATQIGLLLSRKLRCLKSVIINPNTKKKFTHVTHVAGKNFLLIRYLWNCMSSLRSETCLENRLILYVMLWDLIHMPKFLILHFI